MSAIQSGQLGQLSPFRSCKVPALRACQVMSGIQHKHLISFTHLNYCSMKQFFGFLLVLGGLLFAVNAEAQVATETVYNGNPDKTTYQPAKWVSSGDAEQIVEDHLFLLNKQLDDLIAQGASQTDIQRQKAEIAYYMMILEGLQAGKPAWQAVADAYAMLKASSEADAIADPVFSDQEVEGIYTESVDMLTD